MAGVLLKTIFFARRQGRQPSEALFPGLLLHCPEEREIAAGIDKRTDATVLNMANSHFRKLRLFTLPRYPKRLLFFYMILEEMTLNVKGI